MVVKEAPSVSVSRYGDHQAKFDDNLSAIGEYFELFKTHTDLLEDLWLQLLGILGLQNPETMCVFRKYHYECYVKNVMLSDYIRPQIEEAALALSKGEGSEQLGQFLEKIKEIKQGLNLKQSSYADFIASYKSQYNFNENVSRISSVI